MTTPTVPGSAPSVAIVHDSFLQRGGAERVVADLAALFPGATVYTTVADRNEIPGDLAPGRIRTTSLQQLSARGVPLKALAPLLSVVFGRLDVGAPDVVVSSSSAFAHHVRTPGTAVHVCYCHTPPPFLWTRRQYFGERGAKGRLAAPALAIVRRRDRRVAAGVDVYVANSRFTAERIARYYGRDAVVIHPPIDTASFAPVDERSGRFLVVARLRRYKALDLAIEAANALALPLDVVGTGPDRARLQTLAGPTVRLRGRLSDAEVADAMARCTALVVPGIEDFGMATAEVQAAGRPPIAFAAGGTTEIVEDGTTGFLVEERTAAAIGAAMQRAQHHELDRDALVASARRFDRAVFDARMRELVATVAGARPLRGPGAGHSPVTTASAPPR